MRLLILAVCLLGAFAIAQEQVQEQNSEAEKSIVPRAISEPGVDGDKFKIYVGTIDGVRRELFNEVDGGQIEVAPDNTPNAADPFGTYDDNNVISTDNEKLLFVPKPYRPGGDKKETKKTTKTTTTFRTTRPPPPPTTIRTIPFVQTTPATFATLPPVTRPPMQPFQPQPIPTLAPFVQRPPPPTAPPRVIPPQQPLRPIQPQQPFQPQQPQQFTQRPFFPPQTQPTFAPRQPPPVQPQQPQLPPVQPQPQQPQTSPAPRPPFQQGQQLRSGQCQASIFYISTPISGPSRLTFTHFAVAVTVDQCARTCHEFNCAIAHYNPVNGHCEFNPSTAFAIRNGQCPAWPSLHYRNNVVANEPVRIFCVTCQRPRRRPAGRRQFLRGQARRGQRLGRKSGSKRVSEVVATNASKQRQLRAASSEAETVETAAPSRTSSNKSLSQLDLLKQLEDLQL